MLRKAYLSDIHYFRKGRDYVGAYCEQPCTQTVNVLWAAEQALTVLMRPPGAQSLEDLICSSSEEGLRARLGQWQRLSSFGEDSHPRWTPLDVHGVASLLLPLHAFRSMECCRWLAEDDGVGHNSSGAVREAQSEGLGGHALVLLDAAGGEVSVLQQSWTEMMAAKIGSPGVALRPSKDL